MVKAVPQHIFHSDDLEWLPWEASRTMPFSAKEASGDAAVKVLSRDPQSGAETLLYRFEPGWSIPEIENTVYEDLLVLDGEIIVGDHVLGKMGYAYRPPGYRAGPVTSQGGAVVVAFLGAPGNTLCSKTPVDALDADSLPWEPLEGVSWGRYTNKLLRGDEENLEIFRLMRSVRGFHQPADEAAAHAAEHGEGGTHHDVPEESYYVEGRAVSYEGATGGSVIYSKGSYIMRPPGSPHGNSRILEDQITFDHRWLQLDEVGPQRLAAYRVQTPAVKAIAEGRDPGLPRTW